MFDLTLDLEKLSNYEKKKVQEIDFSKVCSRGDFGANHVKRLVFSGHVSLVQLRDILFIFNLYEKIQNKKFGRGVCFHGDIELFTYQGHLIFESDVVEWIFLRDKDGIYQFYEFGDVFLPVLEGQHSPEIYNPE